MAYTVTHQRWLSIPVGDRDPADSGSQFGSAVELDGDRVIACCQLKYVGAVYCGAVYVFDYDSGALTQTILPQVGDRSNSTAFGYSVAADNDWMVIGAVGVDAIYVYEWTGSAYTFRQRLQGSTTVAGDAFGISVDIRGDIIVVGASQDDDAASNAGAVFVFRLAGGVWSEDQIIPSPNAQANALFGYAVTVEDTTGILAAGSRQYDDGFSDEGLLSIYEESGGTFSLADQFAPPTPAAGVLYGENVHVLGGRVIAGGGGHDIGGEPANQGIIGIYEKNGSWSLVQSITCTPSLDSNGSFGGNNGESHGAIKMSGDLLVGGAYGWEGAGAPFGWIGAAHLFLRSGTYSEEDTAYPNEVGQYGSSVAVSKNDLRLVVGGRLAEAPDDLGGNGYGVVRLYSIDLPAPPVATPVDPTKSQSGVASSSSVNFTLTSELTIQTPWTIEIDRGGAGFELALTYNGSAVFEPQFQGAGSIIVILANGFDVTIDPQSPFLASQVVQVRVTAVDDLGQPAVVV